MRELCGKSVSIRCQLPMEDLDALVSVTCDEDLSNLMEEYNQVESSSMKIRAFLSLHKTSNDDSTSPKSPLNNAANGCCKSRVLPSNVCAKRCRHHTPMPNGYYSFHNKSTGKGPCYAHLNPASRTQNANHR